MNPKFPLRSDPILLDLPLNVIAILVSLWFILSSHSCFSTLASYSFESRKNDLHIVTWRLRILVTVSYDIFLIHESE